MERKTILLALIATLCLFFAGCGGKVTKPSTTGQQKTPVTKKGGGYYKDDGPGDHIPDDLDQIPDAQPRIEPLHRFANRPYVVLGKSYTPNISLKTHKQRGIASWYGKKFHGQKTSIGESYDMFAMTAAHPTLALPSYARVTNLGNGKSVIVRINDRGPFHANRIIDLSYAAAYRLDYINSGSTSVEVEALTAEDIRQTAFTQTSPPDVAPNDTDEIKKFAAIPIATPDPIKAPSFAEVAAADSSSETLSVLAKKETFLQLGAFSSLENAESLKAHFTRELDWLKEGIQINPGGLMYRVHLGPYEDRADAERIANRIFQEMGLKPGIIQR